MSADVIAEIRCDRCGRFISDPDQTVDQLRDTLHRSGWASEVGGFTDACGPCCEVIEHDSGGPF